MPILGTVASQFSGKSFSSFESISTVTVGSGTTSSIEFTSIPSTYTHLQIRVIAKLKDSGSGFSNTGYLFNGDTTSSNYSFHWLKGDGSSASAAGAADYPYANMYIVVSSPSNTFTSGVTDILDYSNTNKYKTIRTLTGTDCNGSGEIYLTSTSWRSLSAISSIKMNVGSPGFAEYSQFALYGIKGS